MNGGKNMNEEYKFLLDSDEDNNDNDDDNNDNDDDNNDNDDDEE
jgi:hypothetical protein